MRKPGPQHSTPSPYAVHIVSTEAVLNILSCFHTNRRAGEKRACAEAAPNILSVCIHGSAHAQL